MQQKSIRNELEFSKALYKAAGRFANNELMRTDYDVIIAGAGIVGLATAFKIMQKRPATKLLVVEKEDGPAKHQTGNNSGVIHSGIYYKPGSLKARNCVSGYKELINFCERESIPYRLCGKVIVAVDDGAVARLKNIYERGIANGLDRIRIIDKAELNEIEPYVSGVKAIHVPYTGITDFRRISEKFEEKIVSYGAVVKYGDEVKSVIAEEKKAEILTGSGSFTTSVFVNCCGLYSDKVARMSEKKLNVRIIPFRGEYYKLRPEKRRIVNNLIYPVPDPAFPFLGVHFTRMIDGEVEAGPNAVLSFKKEGYSKSSLSLKDTFGILTWPGFYRIASKYFKTGMGEFYRSYSKSAFLKALNRLIPSIEESDLISGGAGVRAQAIGRYGEIVDDFLIHDSGNVVNVLNAPSPAATSSLSIGDTISEIAIKKINDEK